ncbi:hypothetical protein K6T12_01165 [Marinobacterium sp. CAU 1594]|nr:hypothetical protein [Marinobacterium arenosum]
MFITLLFSSVLLAGCAATGPQSQRTHTVAGIDGVACVGQVMSPPGGFVEVMDPPLLEKALGVSGKGGLCEGRVFEAAEPVAVYRVWNSDKSYTLYGGWWSFEPPHGTKAQYREANAICPSWSTLDRVSRCTLKVGSRVVVGPGQSAQCQDFSYAKSAVNQVYIPNDARNDLVYVKDCDELRQDNWTVH